MAKLHMMYFIYLLSWIQVCLAATCHDLLPDCPIPPPGEADECYLNGLVDMPHNVTVFAGHSGSFTASTITGCAPKVYINDCGADNGIFYNTDHNNTILKFRIEFNETNVSQDKTKVDIYVIKKGITCFPTVYLHVIGPPFHVSNTSVAPLCNSLLVNGVWPPNTNIVYYRVTLKDNILFENFTEKFPVTISESVFKNRTKDYMIELIASNPAGNSSVSVVPVKIKNFLNFNLSNPKIKVFNSSFSLNMEIQSTCGMHIPSDLLIKSNCLKDRIVLYSVERPQTVKDTWNRSLDIPVSFTSNRLNCEIVVSSGEIEYIFPNISTFDLQSMNISTQPNGEVEIICNFLEGSNAKGCHLKVTKLNGNTTRYDVIREGQHALKIIGPYEVGNYIISGYDWESDGNFDSTQVAVSGYFKIDCGEAANCKDEGNDNGDGDDDDSNSGEDNDNNDDDNDSSDSGADNKISKIIGSICSYFAYKIILVILIAIVALYCRRRALHPRRLQQPVELIHFTARKAVQTSNENERGTMSSTSNLEAPLLRKSEESHSEMVEDSAAKSRFVYQARPRRQQDIEYGTVPKPMVDITGSGKAVSLPDPKSNDGFEDAGYLTGDHLAQKKDSNFEVVTPNNTMSDQAGADCDQ